MSKYAKVDLNKKSGSMTTAQEGVERSHRPEGVSREVSRVKQINYRALGEDRFKLGL